MNPDHGEQTWILMQHGPRPSILVASGAVLGALARIMLALGHDQSSWYCWLASLLLVGAGLVLSGLRPWLTAFAMVPGVFYLLQGIALGLTAATGWATAAVAYQLLALPKLLALVILAVVAVRQIDSRRRLWLAMAAGLHSLRTLLQRLHVLHGGTRSSELFAAIVLDPFLAVLLAWALVQASVVLRRLETEWALRRMKESGACLDDFNPLPGGPSIR